MSIDLDLLNKELQKLRSEYDQGIGRRQSLLQQKTDSAAQIKQIDQNYSVYDKTRAFLQSVSEYARRAAKERIEEVVTSALQFIFGQQFTFKIEITNTRNRPEAEFLVATKYDNFNVENAPQDSRGGGIVDVVSVALRFALLETHVPEIDGPVIIDEPFKHASDEFIDTCAVFLNQMSENLERQIIIITHDPRLTEVSDRIIRTEMTAGVSSVEVIK